MVKKKIIAELVVMCTLDGAVVASFGVFGAGAGEMRVPHDIAADAGGRVYVAEVAGARLQIFAKKTNL
jgi:hypothetical protein